ncbi:GAF domain-containing sensor histidine kinase [Chryseolinea lacunae]|uniref:histidine kinase n=1 Tax=Chryseolinea lacunae TaxID=2801331 RepID=A0ABS1KR30_9BACT|nr:GAF domain-containing sensor histidine kinase [Chryseolinea lacunae]MBL0741829.1 GAF domain-containing sensor histidine kinase [Chryseolinea lacunae]
MIIPSKPENENLRLQALHYYDILDTAAEKDFDDIVELASQLCETPISLVSLIDADRQWFKARKGLDAQETSRDFAFCAYAIGQEDEEVMSVADASRDARFSGNPLVKGHPDIRFYAGMPLVTPEGFKLGTLCVIDRKPKALTESQLFGLKILAKQVMKQLELRATVKELKRLNEANSKMLSILGHDLRGPIKNLESVVTLARQEAVSPQEFSELLGMVSKSLSTADVLFTNLMQWAVTQFEDGGPQWQQINIAALIADEIGSHSAVTDKGNAIMLNLDDAARVWADPNMVRFVVRNLVHNANKFTTQGNIAVSIKQHDQHAEICLADTGMGMNAETVSRLFDWSKRRSTVGTHGEKGTGLGLQVCKEVIEKMHGKIWVESEPGIGSRFYFTLPLTKLSIY